ncbi:Cro/CI family transcriptional regulator [Hahella aquimaris]|uniref:Cro/CI family transcriptional regulator n=1 Tax=unclassified Hahella TaxID=2624107 RepID=UPI002441ED6B|nr:MULTISPECIES: Cro/CI family transcriptional regulator [unclassified Hahella]MDG9671848.1 Cro/CI family transcriptional regulator [Hahella sp. CR1]WLQ15614.1 Cro/CI family transcriptional regulator [Hahella sp. HNIBRBA332]
MKKTEAVDYFGNQANLAKALGIAPAAVYQWGDFIPELRAFQLERITNGKLKHARTLSSETTRSV